MFNCLYPKYWDMMYALHKAACDNNYFQDEKEKYFPDTSSYLELWSQYFRVNIVVRICFPENNTIFHLIITLCT